jgi:hypothetical protein
MVTGHSKYPLARLLPRAREIWAEIPLRTDILITHGPPFAHLDVTGTDAVGYWGHSGRLDPRCTSLSISMGGMRCYCGMQLRSDSNVFLSIKGCRAGCIMEWAQRKGAPAELRFSSMHVYNLELTPSTMQKLCFFSMSHGPGMLNSHSSAKMSFHLEINCAIWMSIQLWPGSPNDEITISMMLLLTSIVS